ncbi:hypothetical protein ABT235_17835, partial [Micromonospora echinofusca]|uniref:hypothetical protein n=1 Tax=Micromonospora echinofusca TaxID=47858 RepID=UPI00332C9CAC
MKTGQHPKRHLRLVHRILMAVALAAASLGLSLAVSSPAQAATTTMCSATPVPAGWVVTQAQRDPASCGSHLHYWITNDLYNGMHICSATRVPAGWVAV